MDIRLQRRRPKFYSWVGKIHWKRNRLPTPVFLGFPCFSAGKESTCNVGDLRSIPGLGRYPGEGKIYPLQYSGLKNSMDCIFHGVAESWTRLSDFHCHFQTNCSVGINPGECWVLRIKFIKHTHVDSFTCGPRCL